METTGALLGVFDDAEYDQASFEIGRDEILVLHSDGLEEAYCGRKESKKDEKAASSAHLQAFQSDKE